MGKPKLRSSIKALHQALFNFRPLCIQQAKTDSFRDAYNSFHSMYFSASSCISSDIYSTNEESEQWPDNHMSAIEESLSTTSSSSSTNSNDSHAAELVVKGFISSKRFFFSPYTTKSLSATDSDDSHPAELVVKGFISSQRFFFCPCTTKSIMEELDTQPAAKIEMGYQEIAFSDSQWIETKEIEEEVSGGIQCMIMEKGFCKESVTMAVASMNPFMDFRVSMEEMVVAHGLREWPCLQELLQCYLRLNDKTVHKTIILAFADLLTKLVTEEANKNNSSSSSKEICLPFPLCLLS